MNPELSFDRYAFEFALRPGYKPYARAPVDQFAEAEIREPSKPPKMRQSPRERAASYKARWAKRRLRYGPKGLSKKGVESIRKHATGRPRKERVEQ